MLANPSLHLEVVACPLCRATESTPLFAGPDRAHGVPGRFTMVECRQCGVAYQNPRPTSDSFAAIYPPDYHPYHVQEIDPQRLHPDLAMACRFIASIQPAGGKLIDIGCGPANFLHALRLTHPEWDVLGVEPDEQAAEAARRTGIRVLTSTIERAALPAQEWDAVMLWNVVEHLPDPLAILQQARRLLKPVGRLYVAVPVRDSWDARIFGRYWAGWELPRHYTLFDRRTLHQLFAKAGFSITNEACINGRSYGFTASLRQLLQERVQGFALRRLGEALTYSRPLALALSPYTALSVLAKRCTVLTVAARVASEDNAH